jgi:anti-sigma regulatory factor (Ser/Thr protein kinase)
VKLLHVEECDVVIANRRDDLPEVSRLLDRIAATHDLPADVVVDLHVALDEVLANIVSYAYPDRRSDRIRVAFRVSAEAVEVTIDDHGRAFDPFSVKRGDRSAPPRKRKPGGLGIHFVKSLMTQTRYRRVGNTNRIVLTKRITKEPASGSA